MAKEVLVKLCHNIQHEKPIDLTTPPEIKHEIMENLYMDSRFYKLDEDSVISAHRFLENLNNNNQFCFEWRSELVTAIGFITSLLTKLLPVLSIHCDATYKTVKERFELYGIISNTNGAGFPIAYLLLNTMKAFDNEEQIGLRTKALASFLRSLHNKGLEPQYFFTDKDSAEINATKKVWSSINVQLCLWHVERAIKEKLKSCKRIQRTQYQPEEAVAEFSFIDLTFVLDLKCSESEYYIVCLLKL
ncbi:12724_t:CDS:2 [Ambispora gerdemannii]|uniref:12724_t:CDS:1 n=1 Tax=Ambispora gerdemannii TaxID=144530 RepID=A0A9N9B244_9GLOM|nr:12724_t:CDS:2 [Ambispora gerdemannii]